MRGSRVRAGVPCFVLDVLVDLEGLYSWVDVVVGIGGVVVVLMLLYLP